MIQISSLTASLQLLPYQPNDHAILLPLLHFDIKDRWLVLVVRGAPPQQGLSSPHFAVDSFIARFFQACLSCTASASYSFKYSGVKR